MSKSRASTIQQRFGFKDGDLKTPKHDSMMLWLDENAEVIAEKELHWGEWGAAKVEKLMRKAIHGACLQCEENIESYEATLLKYPERVYYKDNLPIEVARLQELRAWEPEPLPSWPRDARLKVAKTWERPIMSGKYVIGFIDMVIGCSLPVMGCTGTDWKGSMTGDCLPEWEAYREWRELYIEVKTAIPSLGELIRQIRMYQEYRDGKYYVLSPDTRFEKPLRSQGIGFIRYPSE